MAPHCAADPIGHTGLSPLSHLGRPRKSPGLAHPWARLGRGRHGTGDLPLCLSPQHRKLCHEWTAAARGLSEFGGGALGRIPEGCTSHRHTRDRRWRGLDGNGNCE